MTNSKSGTYLTGLAFIAALGGFLFGYDTAVISGTLSFVRRQFILSPGQEGWYVSSALIGCVISVLWAGWLSDKYGRKKVLLLTAVLFSTSAIGCALAPGFSQLVGYRFVGGMGVGIASMLSPMYISEISPPDKRGRLVALYQLAITIGILAAFFINSWLLGASYTEGFLNRPVLHQVFKNEVWRSMLGMESIPALAFLLLILTVPESPRWLVVQNKLEKARKILNRTAGMNNTDSEIKAIQAAMAMETGSWKMLFDPGIRVAVFLGVSLAMLAQFAHIHLNNQGVVRP